MNRLIVILVVLASVFSSCQKSKETKVSDLVADHMYKTLYHPESYESVETVIDSAFTPFDSPELYEKTLKFAKLSLEMSQLEIDEKNAKSNMALWSGHYRTEFGINEFNEAKEKHDQVIKKQETVVKKLQDLAEEIKGNIAKKPEFLGFKARHKYRASNNAGQTVFGNVKFLFDEEITKIVTEYDMDGEEYNAVMQIYKMLRGEE